MSVNLNDECPKIYSNSKYVHYMSTLYILSILRYAMMVNEVLVNDNR